MISQNTYRPVGCWYLPLVGVSSVTSKSDMLYIILGISNKKLLCINQIAQRCIRRKIKLHGARGVIWQCEMKGFLAGTSSGTLGQARACDLHYAIAIHPLIQHSPHAWPHLVWCKHRSRNHLQSFYRPTDHRMWGRELTSGKGGG